MLFTKFQMRAVQTLKYGEGNLLSASMRAVAHGNDSQHRFVDC
jgi:hypothetical protein